jgi:DNA polymerase
MHAAPDNAARAQLGKAWLLVLESPTPTLPAETAALLANMLQAMGLHQHPQVWLALLEPQGTAAPASSNATPAHAMPQTLADAAQGLNASMVLLLGPGAVRAALGSTAPLGKLRGQLHAVGTSPAVVSYDPGFLLRSQATKAAAWADLCSALAHVAAQAQAPIQP